MTQPAEQIDEGHKDACANAARSRRTVQVALEGAGATGKSKIDVLRYDDAHLIDRMHRSGQLWNAPYAAAQRVLAIYRAATDTEIEVVSDTTRWLWSLVRGFGLGVCACNAVWLYVLLPLMRSGS
jgi:hypothetical protein